MSRFTHITLLESHDPVEGSLLVQLIKETSEIEITQCLYNKDEMVILSLSEFNQIADKLGIQVYEH